MASSERLFSSPRSGALMVSVGIGAGFDTPHELEHGLWPRTRFRILPFIRHAIGPPDRMHRLPHGAATVL